MIKVVALDLSTTCIGCTFAWVKDKRIKRIVSKSIRPKRYDPKELGFVNKSRKKIKTPNGLEINAFLYEGETSISKSEKLKRDVLVRKEKRLCQIESINKQLNKLLEEFSPDLILVEQNMSFRSQTSTKRLGEVAGSLHFYANSKDIPIKEFNLNTLRGSIDLRNIRREFVKRKTVEELKKLKDVTKASIRDYLLSLNRYKTLDKGINLDESDSLLVFDYWYRKEILKK